MIDCVLRTRRARSGFVLLRTLDARGNATETPLRLRYRYGDHRTLLPLVFKFFLGGRFLNFFGVEEGCGWASFQQRSVWFP